MVTALKISRAQLAKICGGDHDMIRQFETLFSAVASQDTDTAAVEPGIQIEAAGNLALARIERLERAFQMLELRPLSHAHSILDVIGLQDAIDAISEPYSTTESLTNRKWIDGKTIYRKVINFGALPNSTAKAVAHGITGLGQIVHIYGTVCDGTTYVPLPASATVESWGIELSANATNVAVTTGQDRSLFSGYIVIEYTKA